MAQVIANGMIAGSIYSLVAISFALIYYTTHFFHIAHGAIITWGAYLCFTFFSVLKWPLWSAILTSILACIIIGVLLDLVIYRVLRKREASHLVLLMASLGLYVVLQNAISMIFGDGTQTIRSGGIQAESVEILGAQVTRVQIWTLAVVFASFTLVGLLMKHTRFGLTLRAVSNDAELVKIDGINSNRVIGGAFALGSALASLVAILLALDVDMNPTMGLNVLMMGVVAMIVGGVRSYSGCLLGGYLLGLVQHLGVWKLGTQWQDAIAFGILILCLVARPWGILGRPLHKLVI